MAGKIGKCSVSLLCRHSITMCFFFFLNCSLHHIGPTFCASATSGNGFLKSPLDGTPLSSAQSHWPTPGCQNDLGSKNTEQGIDCLNQWLDIGAEFNSQTFRFLYPIDGNWADRYHAPALEDTLDHRIVGFDAKVAGLLNVDSVNGGFQVSSSESVQLFPCRLSLCGPIEQSGSPIITCLHPQQPSLGCGM